jgi:hypothetical protein
VDAARPISRGVAGVEVFSIVTVILLLAVMSISGAEVQTAAQ